MPLRPAIRAPLGKSGPLMRAMHGLEDLLLRRFGVAEHPLHGVVDLAQVVRRDVGRHADGDARRAVDQQVREPCRQHDRLGVLVVVVRLEVDGVLVDVADHLHGQRVHLAFGVPHGGGAVVARRSEVALAVHQLVPHHPALRQPDEGVVNRRVTVRVILAHDVTDDAGALVPAAVGAVAAVEHRVQDAAVHRLEAVADVGQGPAHDDAHRVVEVAALDLLVQIDGGDPPRHRRELGVADGRGGLRGCGRDGLEFGTVHGRFVRRVAHRVVFLTQIRCRGTGRPWRCAG